MKGITIAVMALGLCGLALWRADKPTPNSYRVENQWGGSNASWKAGGDWVIGARDTQRVIKVDAESSDDGKTLFGTMQYEKEGPIGFRATNIGGNEWTVENQWGGDHAPWHQGGTWVLGGRNEHALISLQITSDDNGATFAGIMTYSGEGAIGFRAEQRDNKSKGSKMFGKKTQTESKPKSSTNSNSYSVENQWGGSNAAWNEGGAWIIGGRDTQRVIKVEATSSDDGKTLIGKMQYEKEGPIGFRATNAEGNKWAVENQWGGDHAPWHQGGIWVLGGRNNHPLVSLQIESDDNGATFTGSTTYSGEGPIGLRAQQGMTQKNIEVEQNASLGKKPQPKKETYPKSESVKKSDPNDYKVENQWGGSNAVWNQGGSWKIGSRDNQKVINVDISSSDDGKTLFGTIQYENEGPIGFKATHQKDNEWSVQNQWGGESAPWHQAGNWVLGGRENHPIVKLQASSDDSGMTLIGTMTYNAEGPIGFRATHA